MKTLLDPACRQAMLLRFRSLRPDAQPRWGTLTAARMLTHLSDQLRHTLGDIQVPVQATPLRWPGLKQAVMYWLPWPKGKIKGPPEMFATVPGSWTADLADFEALLARFIAPAPRAAWPDHPVFGRMTQQSWGRFCHRHFDYHLRQFGA